MTTTLRRALGFALALAMAFTLLTPILPAWAAETSAEEAPEITTEEPTEQEETEVPVEIAEPEKEPSEAGLPMEEKQPEPPAENKTQPEVSPEKEPTPEPTAEEAPANEPEEAEETPVEEQPPIMAPMRKAPLLAAAKLSPWTFHNIGWDGVWYIYCPPDRMYSQFSATKSGVTKPAYCMNRDLDSPEEDVDYQLAAFPTSKHYQVAKIVTALGYPNNSVARIKEMFGYDLSKMQAQQATQVAIGAAQKAVAEGWTVNKTYNEYVEAMSGYQAVFDYSKALCTRALELLNNPKTAAKYTIDAAVTNGTTSKVTVTITPYRAYGNYKINIKSLPKGTLLTTGQNTRVVDSDGNLSTAKNKAVSGSITIRGMAGKSGEAVAKFTLSSIPRGTADTKLTITATSYSKLAATDDVEWGKAPDNTHQNMIVAGMAEGTTVTASKTATVLKAPPPPPDPDPEPEEHHLTVKKVVTVDGEQWPVSGVTFTLMHQNGSQWQSVGTLVEQTGNPGVYRVPESNGQWTFKMVEGGTYKVVETSATNEVINSGWESSTFVWKENTVLNLSYNATDELPTGHIGILKQDSETNKPIEGVGFEVTAAEDIVAKVGNRSTVIYEKGEVITEGETNAEGKMVVKELPYGKYTVTETTHPEGYAAENVSFSTTVGAPSDYSASKVYPSPMIGYTTYPAGMAVVSAGGLRYVTVGNTPIHPDMAVAKLTERTTNRDGKAVAFDANTGRYTQEKVPGTYYNGQNAKFTVTVTNTGDVDLYDLQVKDVMSPELWSVVDKDSKVTWRQMENTPLALGQELKTGSKVKTTSGKDATVTKVSYDAEQRTFTISFDRLAVGDSFQIQIACAILNTANVNRNALPNDVYLYSYHKTNGTTGTITKTPGGGEGDCHDVDALNVVSQGNVTIHKQDAKGQPLAGVHFEMTDASGHPVSFVLLDSGEYAATVIGNNGDWIPAAESGKPTTADLVTDKNGNLKLTQLPEGRYTLTETKTVEGQSLLAEPITIEMPLVQPGAQVDYPGNVYFDSANNFYDQSCTITNSAPYQLPLTGGNGTWLTVAAGIVLLTLCVGWLVFSGDFSQRRRAVCANPQ